MKVETDIITSITGSLERMSWDTSGVCQDIKDWVNTIVFFIGNVIMCLRSHLTDNVQYHGKFIDTENVPINYRWDQ